MQEPTEVRAFSKGGGGGPSLLLAGHRSVPRPQNRVHRQPPFYLLHYITQGHGRVFGPTGVAWELDAGDWFFCFPGQGISYESDPQLPWCYRWTGFLGEGADALLLRAGISDDTWVRKGDPDPQNDSLLREMFAVLTEDRVAADVRANALLLRLLAHLIETGTGAEHALRPGPTRSIQAYVDQACQFMANHFPDGIRAADVSTYVGFERSYFSKAFAETAGQTLQEYLASLRQQKAESLLRHSVLSIECIAGAVGFGEAKTFSRFFRRRTGLAPREWRCCKQAERGRPRQA